MATKVHQSRSINPIETLSDFGGKELAQAGKDFGRTFIDQILGTGAYEIPKSGDLQQGKELNLTKRQQATSEHAKQVRIQTKEAPHQLDVAPGMRYHEQFRSLESQADKRENQEISRAIQEIQVELQRLVASSSLLQVEFSGVTMSQTPSTPGKYHINFFQWVLTIVKQARMQVEDAGAWQASLKGKNKKGGFWGRAKSEGTSFLLHHDRSAATSAG